MVTTRIVLRNTNQADLIVHIEPWGEQHVLVNEDSLEVVFYGPASGKPEIHVGNAQIVVFAWQGCQAFVLKNNLCVRQPSLLKIIDRICTATKVDKSALRLEPEIIEFAQNQLDRAESWNAEGREAAIQAVAKVAPLLVSLRDNGVVWKFCQTVLQSRGVFLHHDPSRQNRFFSELRRSTGDVGALLTEWREASAKEESLSENVTAD